MPDKATLKIGDKTIDLPVVQGSEEEIALDIRHLRAETGAITYDPGYANTGSCKSDITFIDGEKGVLRYCGYPIEQLAERSSFLEVCSLLLNGELPNGDELHAFKRSVSRHTMLHEDVNRFYRALPKDAHPMAVCSTVVAALSTFYPHLHDLGSPERTQSAIIRLIAKLPTIAALCFKHSKGQPAIYPDNDLDYSSNFLRMMFATPCESYDPDPVIAKAVDQLLVLHADHEQNCSTSAVRLVGSSRPHLFACIAAGIGALWGPLHGGANQKVIEMLERIEREEGSAAKFVARAKDKGDSARLMGFGHRVYKNYDPRAKILRKTAIEVLDKLGVKSRLLDIGMDLEEVALNDPYFIERKLYPNVDFYSGIIYKAIGIPVPMFTVLFAMGRLPGWIAQWVEMHHQDDFRIGRPRQVYTGPTLRDYVPIEDR